MKFLFKVPKEHRGNVEHHEKTKSLNNRLDYGKEYQVKGIDLKFQHCWRKRSAIIQKAVSRTDRWYYVKLNFFCTPKEMME